MKKSNLIITLLIFTATAQHASSTTLSLSDVLKEKKVSCLIKGNGASTHYLEPILLEVTNLSNETVSIIIDNGDLFIPTDEHKQNIVVTEPEVLVLQPKSKQSIKVKGMCTEPNDASGTAETVYTFKPRDNEKLKKLSDFIAEKKYQSSAAQYAVWTLVTEGDINSIYSSDSIEENELKKFMANLTGKTFALKTKDYRTNYYAPPKEKVGGAFEYSFIQAQDVQIAMFDKNGILVRELYNQKKVPAGAHKINFEYDSSVYTDDIYYFKLIAGNEVMVNRKWDAQAMRDAFKKKIENRE